MLRSSIFLVCIAIALVRGVLSISNDEIDSVMDPVPWFVVQRYLSNVSAHNRETTVRRKISETSTQATNKQLSLNVCETKTCNVMAESFITNMDSTVDPCDDFYEFVCGGWPSAHPLTPSDSSVDQFGTRYDIINKQIREILEEEIDVADLHTIKDAKRAYQACMDIDAIEKGGVESLLAILDENGGWPIMMDASRRQVPKLTWQEVAANYSQMYGISTLFQINVNVDLKNATQHVITIDQPDLGISGTMYNDEDDYLTLFNIFTKFIEDVAIVFAGARRSRVPRDRISKDARKIYQFETDLKMISAPDSMRKDLDRMYNLRTIRQLQNWYDEASPKSSNSEIDWLKIVKSQFIERNVKIDVTDKVVVKEMQYLFKLARLLENTPPRTIVNYIHWRMVEALLPSTTQKLRDLVFEVEKFIFGMQEPRERWQWCAIDNKLKHAISYQYVKKYVNDATKDAAIDMVTEVQEELGSQISVSSWMDESTKIAAKEKLNSMRKFISHPDWYENKTAILDYYKGLVITEDHFENTLNFHHYERDQMIGKYKNTVIPEVWPIAPIEMNALYSSHTNALGFPAAILQPPFFSSDLPDSLNYGCIGAVIGHEIAHGFDDFGRLFDKDGSVKQWWSDETIKAFMAKAQCFVDQYNNYTVPELTEGSITYRLNGKRTLGENIADSTGLGASYEIFQRRFKLKNTEEPKLPGLESFTREQLFFIAYGNTWCETATKEQIMITAMHDPHATNHLRVIGTLGNSEGFNKAFNCSTESKMNRQKKCNLWK